MSPEFVSRFPGIENQIQENQVFGTFTPLVVTGADGLGS